MESEEASGGRKRWNENQVALKSTKSSRAEFLCFGPPIRGFRFWDDILLWSRLQCCPNDASKQTRSPILIVLGSIHIL